MFFEGYLLLFFGIKSIGSFNFDYSKNYNYGKTTTYLFNLCFHGSIFIKD